MHIVKWLIVCKEKRKKEGGGGLGIKSLSLLTRALMGRWCWRYAFEEETFGKRIIQGKYGEEGVVLLPSEGGAWVWATILKGALKARLGLRRNYSLVIVPCLPRHVPCWRGVPCQFYFSFLVTSTFEISSCILKFI